MSRVGAPPISRTWRVVRLVSALLVAISCLVILGVILTYAHTSDLPAFLLGAQRIANGDSPYAPVPEPLHKFLYAPWFAVALIPATWFPMSIVAVVWHALLAVGTALAVWPLFRSGRLEGVLAGSLIGMFSFHGVWAGHYESLLIALLVWALPTRWGAVAIGIAVSIKVTPIVLCVRYAARREWMSVLVVVGVAAGLWAPALLFDLQGWGVNVGHTLSLLGYSPILWALTAFAGLGAAYVLAPTRYGWLAASVAWLAVLPRMLLYDVSSLAIAAAELRQSPDREARP